MKRMCGSLALFMILTISSIASQERGAFAPLGVGARPTAMGGAFSALADDLQATYWNPAGLVQLSRPEVSTTHTQLFGLGVNFDHLAYGQKLGDWSFAFSNQTLDASAAFETFAYREQTSALSVARKIRNYALGVNVKLYKLQGGNESLSDREEGLGLDLGCLIPVKDKLQVGIVCKDLFSKLAGQLQIEEQARKSQTELGPDLTLGLAYLRERSTWAVDFSELITNPEFKLGVEYAVASNLKVRAGYKPGSLSVGLGIASGKFIFDYAYMTHELKDEQRLSVGLSF